MANSQTPSPVQTIIFDFDGTIADSFGIFLETLQEVVRLPEPLTPDLVTQFRGASVRQIMQQLHLRSWQLPRLLMKGRRRVAGKMDRVAPFPGMPDALQNLSNQGYELHILSTNSPQAVQRFLERHGLGQHFTSLSAGAGLSGKAGRLKKLVKQQRLELAGCVYVGDEIRDIEAAHRIGMKMVAVSWGYNTAESLAATGPEALIHQPEQLLEVVTTLR